MHNEEAWVEDPLQISDPDSIAWRDSADVLVIGFGGAGACAALEAAAQGARVLIAERFDGGGATALSGGVVYAGGTRFQHEAGFSDSPDEMFKYLKLETGGCVQDSTLKRFCDDSNANLEWLIGFGARFSSALDRRSCSYPAAGAYLYFSGNEAGQDYARFAKPAPRGHRHVGGGMTGRYIYKSLREAVLKHPSISVVTHSPATRLVIDANREIVGIEINEVPPGSAAYKRHRRLIRWVNAGGWYLPRQTLRIAAKLREIERASGRRHLIRARSAVILTTGGFIYNPVMLARCAPGHEGIMPLGTVGCDGSGIHLGESVGGCAARLDCLGVSINIKLSQAYERGIVVNRQGERFCREDCYGAVLGRATAEQGGKAWLITDRRLHAEAWREMLVFWKKPMFELIPLLMGLLFGTRKSKTLAGLADKCGIPAQALSKTVTQYNSSIETNDDDQFGKSRKYLQPLGPGPFYALDVSINNKITPGPALTLGGLLVDESTGQVMARSGEPIKRLYAAGRAAYGIPSNWLISGTTLADVIFSGRRAGRHAANNVDRSH